MGRPRLAWTPVVEYNRNRRMASRTVHVFSSDGAWEVKSEGAKGHIYASQREAIAAALKAIRNKSIGQLVIHGKKGQIRERDTYGMTPIQDPPRRSRAAKRIGRAVGKVALRRVQSDSSQ